jgi:glycosyltransferase involved in cell wall biosynthesis
MRVLMLPKYGRRSASFRARFEQFLPYFREAGIFCDVSVLLDDNYLSERFSSGRRSIQSISQAIVRRIAALSRAKRYDLVYLHYEVFPYVPALFERWLNILRVPYVFDFDDPIFHYYDLSPNFLIRIALRNKIARVISGAHLVFAGSPYLVEYAKRFNSNVEYAPTVVDLNRFPRSDTEHVPGAGKSEVIIGWIGSPSTAPYLLAIAEPLRRFFAQIPGRLVVVGAGPEFTLPGIPMEVRPWSEERELADLRSFDVGVMPLTDDPWSRGKCAYKLIQYMACELPVIASPVGVNQTVVVHGVSGLLASDDKQWLGALQTLAHDRYLRLAMGSAGRSRVESLYSVQKIAPQIVRAVQRAARAC